MVFSGCPPEAPRTTGSLGQSGGALSLRGASLAAPEGALYNTISVVLQQETSGVLVEIDENEAPVSDVFSMTHDQNMVVHSAAAPFRLVLPFNLEALGAVVPDDVHVFVKIATDDGVFSVAGTILGNGIEILMHGLPYRADFQVMYNPNRILMVDEEEAAKRLTPLPPWEATRWAVYFDAQGSVIKSTVGAIKGKPASSVTVDDVREVVRNKIVFPAHDVSVYYMNMGLRQPNVEVRSYDSGKKRLMLHIVNNEHKFKGTSAENGIGQITIGAPAMAWPPTYHLGTCKGVIAHEAYHACVSGYEIKRRSTAEKGNSYAGYNEGMATVMGHTVDNGGTIAVRENHGEHNYVMMLNTPLGVCVPRAARYTNDDFFAYVGERFGGGSMDYLAGTGVDTEGDRNGVLEQTRKHLLSDTTILPSTSPLNDYFTGYRIGLHNALQLQFGVSAADVYWDFAMNRAYESNGESRLRPTDSGPRWQLRSERFDTGAIYEYSFAGDDEQVELSYSSIPALKNIEPFSTRALLLKAGGFDADLTISFDTMNWFEDAYGNCVRVKVYKVGEDGTELSSTDAEITLEHFGDSFDEVVVLISNVAIDGPVSVVLNARTQPAAVPRACTPLNQDLAGAFWLMQWDLDCDGVFEDDILWGFNSNGTISWQTIPIPSSSWSVVDDRISILFPDYPMYGQMEATFSEDCNRMENGSSELGRCWKAERW